MAVEEEMMADFTFISVAGEDSASTLLGLLGDETPQLAEAGALQTYVRE